MKEEQRLTTYTILGQVQNLSKNLGLLPVVYGDHSIAVKNKSITKNIVNYYLYNMQILQDANRCGLSQSETDAKS